jgi:probable rRNA maturation factor
MPNWAPTLGDVVISIETAKRQAREHSLSDEVIILLVHGLMHLLGHDHDRPAETARMLAAENRFLVRRGLRSGLMSR